MTEKYRAKRKDNGEWVQSCSMICFNDGDILFFKSTSPIGVASRPQVNPIGIQAEMIYVDPATLSRCSGLTACGQEVYEGDIIRFHIDHTTEFWTAVLRFGWHDTYEYGWYLEPIRDTMFTKRIGAWFGENLAFGSTAAVVGNVWDNPEMMGVQT